ncbi:hypothetical protein AAFF_G00178250 [Aldrovandia affinis]|uniref:GAS2-like protein 1 n=1 Tax=Aldrovandia affinis TaxID=143900 RepID=A0AAD7RKT8_9TELE|nr:hypothetical protein AAFF_G00178250 [Aldrovandia affinis]
MKEDLAEWLNTLYDLEIGADAFMEGLETGCALCRHANNVNRAALDFQLEYPEAAHAMRVPSKDVVFQSRNVVPGGSFLARDNVSNFIAWCRQELWIKDVLMFETNDLVQRRNEKNFVLCLLEVARRGAKFGMLAPMLIQLEEEIEEEIRDQEHILGEPSPPTRALSRTESVGDPPPPGVYPSVYPSWQQKRVLCDMRNLDELVREILGRCSCPAQFPMTKVSEGKYKVGDSSALIFIRVLRTHVMVRVGGGWDTLEHYLDKHDPCRCSAFAHRHQQSKGGQAPHSKSSSAHSSRSTSPGPHWRNEGIVPYKTPDRRPLDPAPGPASSTSPATRPGRPHRPSGPVELDANVGRGHALLPRPPRDHSDPRHVTPLRNKDTFPPATRRLSGGSDSSTCSSKGGGGGCGGTGGGRASLGGPRRPGEEVVLLVNRREGRHVIERPKEGAQITALRLLQPRARSHSRERPAPAALKPSPPQGAPEGSRSARSDRGRSVGPEGPRRLQAPRSHSQGKLSSRVDAGPGPQIREPQPFHNDRGEDHRAKQAPTASPRFSAGGFSRRQTASSHSPAKGGPSSPAKKTGASPRPPPPRSPSTGKSRLLPPVSQTGRRSPHSSPRSAHHHAPRSPRASRGLRTSGHGRMGRGGAPPERLLPSLDPQKEQDLYRTFEAEFLANTQLATGADSSRGGGGREPETLQLPVAHHHQQPGLGALPPPTPVDPNVTDSAYSSSSSSTSSLNVGGKMGTPLPDLRESKRAPVSPLPCPLENAATLVDSPNHIRTHNGPRLDPEGWGCRGPRHGTLPTLSGSLEDGVEFLGELAASRSHGFTQPALRSGDIGGVAYGLESIPQPLLNQNTGAQVDGRQGRLDWTRRDKEGGEHPDLHPGFSFDADDRDDDLPPPEECPSPVLLPPSQDGSFQDSSSESSSMCISLSEPHSEDSPPPANGDAGVVLRPKKGVKKPDRVPSIYKLKLRPRIRPRTDNRPEDSPSRIPTPSRKALHQALADLIDPQVRVSPLGRRDCSSSVESGSQDDEAWM